MGELRDSILRQQLQKEIDLAKALEAKGKSREAGPHYLKAAAIYRRIAFNAPRPEAEQLMSHASQYENMGAVMKKLGPHERAYSHEAIESMIVSQRPDTNWEDIGGLEEAKTIIKEAIIIPFIRSRPDFVQAPRTILLYGPPGTGKTMLAKASSNNLNASFFEARASSLLSKYFGESTKLVNALFSKAREMQPSLIFMDEIDSLAPGRDAGMDESTRRVLGQLLSEVEGFNTRKDEGILFMGATNKPWDLDDAMVSRFQRKIYVPLPGPEGRSSIFEIHLSGARLQDITPRELAGMSRGYSGRDIANVCQEAIIQMIREKNPKLGELTPTDIEKYSLIHRSLIRKDFENAFGKIKPSMDEKGLDRYMEWKMGMGG